MGSDKINVNKELGRRREGKIQCDIVQLLSDGRRTERGVEGKI